MNIDLKIGDIVLAGKFQNKKVKVTSIGTNELGQPTYNGGNPILKFRIQKLIPIKEMKTYKLSKLLEAIEKKTGKKVVLKEHGYYNPPEPNNHFLDDDEESLTYLFDKYKLEDDFWNDLIDSNKESKFIDGLTKIFDDTFHKFFMKNHDDVTPLYLKVIGKSYKQLEIGRKIWKYIVDKNPSSLQNFMKQYIKK